MHMFSKSAKVVLKDDINPAYPRIARSPATFHKIDRFNAPVYRTPPVLPGFQTVLPVPIPRMHFRLAVAIMALLAPNGSHNKISSLICDFFAATAFDIHRI